MDRHTIKRPTRPLIIAGNGIRLADAIKELNNVLGKGIPCVTTFNGFDLIPSDHPSFVGRIGAHGTYSGHYALDMCDLLICIGTRNNMRQILFDWNNFAEQAYRIGVDIDYQELIKPSVKYDERIWMDAKEYLTNFDKMVDFDIEDGWLSECKEYGKKHIIELSQPYEFIKEFTEELPEGSVVVCGNGTACVGMHQVGIVKKGQRIFWNSGTATMGYALPAAIGAHFATGKRIYCLTGDGSIMMNLQELQTIKHYKIPISIIVLNNNGYRSIEMTQENYFKGEYIGCNEESGVSMPHFMNIAETFGLFYFDSYHDSIKSFIDFKYPSLFNVHIDEKYKFNPKFTAKLEG